PSFDDETLAILSHSIMQLLGVWPSLQSLVISGTAPELSSPAPEPFPCALSSLRINLQASPSVDFFKWLLHNSSDSLRKLEFERELSPSVEDALSSTGVYKRLSDNVESIAFGLNKDTQLQAILDIIKTKESIKAVTVNLWNGGELHRQLASLKTTCALRGIDLELTQDVRAFRSITVRDS
ncbi:hypothetical protein MPER_09399, partial [Moniliophthora perniciosa FA553]